MSNVTDVEKAQLIKMCFNLKDIGKRQGNPNIVTKEEFHEAFQGVDVSQSDRDVFDRLLSVAVYYLEPCFCPGLHPGDASGLVDGRQVPRVLRLHGRAALHVLPGPEAPEPHPHRDARGERHLLRAPRDGRRRRGLGPRGAEFVVPPGQREARLQRLPRARRGPQRHAVQGRVAELPGAAGRGAAHEGLRGARLRGDHHVPDERGHGRGRDGLQDLPGSRPRLRESRDAPGPGLLLAPPRREEAGLHRRLHDQLLLPRGRRQHPRRGLRRAHHGRRRRRDLRHGQAQGPDEDHLRRPPRLQAGPHGHLHAHGRRGLPRLRQPRAHDAAREDDDLEES